MRAYIQQYVDHLRIEKGLSENSIDVYTRDLLEFAKFVKVSSVSKLARTHIREFLCFLSEKNNQPITRRRKLTSLKNFFIFLENENKIKNNPTKNIPTIKVQAKEPSYLSEGELRKLLKAINDDKTKYKKRNEILMRILIETGVRLSEVVNLDIGNIDTEARLITVRRKGGQEQSVPINSDLTRLIRLFTKGKDKSEPLLISSFGKRITQRRVGLLIQEYFKKAGIQKANISCHSLRHSFCSRLLEKGVDLKTIQLLAGHKNISTTERYLHIANTKLRKEAMLAEIA